MEGTTRTTKYQRRMGDEYRDPQEQPMTTGSEKLGSVNVIKETKTDHATKEINFTKMLTLFRNYPDLKYLTTADGKKAVPLTTLKATGGRAHDNNTVQKITQGMLHLYPYICEARPNNVKAPGDHGDHEWNRRLKPEYVQQRKKGALEKYTKNTRRMSEISDWPAQIKALREAGNNLKDIMQLLSMYPLANQTKHFEDAEVEWTEQERETFGYSIRGPGTGGGRHDGGTELANKDQEKANAAGHGQMGKTGGPDENAGPGRNPRTHQDTGHPTVPGQGKRAKREPEEEILAGKPNSEQRYWKHVTHLEISTGETNPDLDIKHAPGTKDKQLRTEGDTTYCYEPEGGLIGTLSTAKAQELYDMYAQAVGDTAAQRPTEEQLAKRLKLKLEHKIHVDSFEEEIAQLLIRMEEILPKRAENPQHIQRSPAQGAETHNNERTGGQHYVEQGGNKDALGRWALQFAAPDTTEEDINGDQWRQWERGETEEIDLQPDSQWDNNGKGYPEPDRRFNKNDMVYTDGNQRKIKREDGEQEEATAASVWDPRGGLNMEHMQRWQGHCQTVNKAELTAIYMALTLDANTVKEEMQEDDIEFQQMEQEEEATPMLAQNMQTLQQEDGGHETQPMVGDIREGEDEPTQEDEWEVEEGELRRMQEEEMTLTHEEQHEQREPQNQQEPDHARPATRTASQENKGAQEGQQDIALQVTQEMELPETQDMCMEAQQEAEDELIEMAQQQEEAQEEQRALQEMAQQQATTQREAQLAQGWRRALMEKIRIAAKETPEKYMQHLRGDTTMHTLSNE
ncbi:hypothetical protein CYMTET_18970 [Cymbomonas tetramitiformis]|uniref:Uncharacterized protein n=1 Tax=Cymbomonas tetramitiformis TaxID=36881 RepID=A0AAE0L5F3_9CHLO|nr:hypothetical protein CYMTET_18970 [Cymbomonas tetramitiformis]